MFADICDDGVYVDWRVAEDEGVVHVNDDIIRVGRSNAIEWAVVEREHHVAFCEESCLVVVQVEQAPRASLASHIKRLQSGILVQGRDRVAES